MKLQPQDTLFPRSNPSWRQLPWALASLALGAFPLLGSTNIVLHLRNGDRLSGTVVRENSRSIIVRTPVAGRITVPLTWIERREAPGTPSVVATPPVPAPPASNPTLPAPTPPPPTANPQAATSATVAAQTAPRPATPTTAQTPPVLPSGSLFASDWMPGWLAPFTTNWHGNVGLGMNLGFGTTDRQTFFATANATHSWRRVVNAVNLNAAYGLVDQVEAANRLEGMVKTDVFLDRKRHLYAYNLALGGYDSIRLIDRRLEEGVGLGYRIYERPRLVVNLEGGAQFQHFNYAQQPDRSLWSARISENLNWKPSDKMTLTQKLQFMPNVTDPSDYRVRFDLIVSYPLFRRITVSLNAVNEYESIAPRGVDHNDLQITTNVNLTF